MAKFEVGKKYHYTGSLSDAFDFVGIWIDVEDAEYIASGKPLTVEWCEWCEWDDHPRRIKFKEFDCSWAFTDAMLNKFVEVPPYGESVESSKASYIARHTEWVKENNVRVGTKVRVTRTAEDFEGGWDNTWESKMDKNVGRTGTVREIGSSNGLYIDFGTGEDRAKYRYPFFVLEVVEETPAPTAEVDWEEKYTALKDEVISMLSALSDVAGDFKEEIESL